MIRPLDPAHRKWRRYSWGHRNLSRFLRSTGEQPKSLLEIRQLLTELGLSSTSLPLMPGYGVFADGQIWGTLGQPLDLIDRPYELSDEKECLLELLAEYTTLRIDFHRPSPGQRGMSSVTMDRVRRAYDRIKQLLGPGVGNDEPGALSRPRACRR